MLVFLSVIDVVTFNQLISYFNFREFHRIRNKFTG